MLGVTALHLEVHYAVPSHGTEWSGDNLFWGLQRLPPMVSVDFSSDDSGSMLQRARYTLILNCLENAPPKQSVSVVWETCDRCRTALTSGYRQYEGVDLLVAFRPRRYFEVLPLLQRQHNKLPRSTVVASREKQSYQ